MVLKHIVNQVICCSDISRNNGILFNNTRKRSLTGSLIAVSYSEFNKHFLIFYGRGYWPEPFQSIIPYWPELFRSIIPYWPELFRSINPYRPEQFRSINAYWPEPFKLMIPCEMVEKALKLWTLSKTSFSTMLYIKCLDSLYLSLPV